MDKLEIQNKEIVKKDTIKKQKYPILEYDPYSKPIIKAKSLYAAKKKNEKINRCLLTYFQDLVEKYERDEKINQAFRMRTEGVRPRVYEMEMPHETIYVVPVPGGAPQAARMLEIMSAMGVKKFMVCGGAGTLDDSETLAKVLVPVSAVRDEGTSYHYLPPSREVKINRQVLDCIEKTLRSAGELYMKVKTWTTDASFRETEDKVTLRRAEGCTTVEMECAAYYAVAEHMSILCGQLLYAGDVVKKEGWEYRNWHTATDMRDKLFNLALKCLMAL